MILPMLRDGRLHLSGIVVLVPHLTPGNRQSLLKRAVHKTKRQIEKLVAEVAPREDVPARMRKLPARRAQAAPAPALGLTPETVEGANSQLTPETVGCPDAVALPAHEILADEGAPAALQLTPDTVAPASARSTRVEPLAPAGFRVQFTADAELHDMLERLQALMCASVPDGDLAAVLKVAVAEKLERLEARRFARTDKPRKTLAETDTTPRSRHVPAAVRRAVHERDGGRCTYVDARGRRCKAREGLEFHHHGTPFGLGGDHSVGNVRLACRAHNALMAEQDYGKERMARFRRPADRASQAEVTCGAGSTSPAAKLPGTARWPASAPSAVP